MVNYEEVIVKLTRAQLKKLKSPVKNNHGTILTLIRLGFLRVVFSGGEEGGGQFDTLSYFKKNLSNINITLYNY